MNNTVSPKQVQAITREIDEIMSGAKAKAEDIGNEFMVKIKGLWADTNAVDFAKVVGADMGAIISSFANSGNALKDGVVDIANFYARKGGKPTMNAPHLHFNSAINASVVKDSFEGTDGDYGFKDPSSIGSILGEVTALSAACKKLGEETSSRLASINAFGNPEIKTKLLSSAGNIANNLYDRGKQIEKFTESKLQSAAKEYNIGDVGAFFKDATTNITSQVGSGVAAAASAGAGLAKTAVEDPQLFRDAFTYAATGTDTRGIMDNKNL